MLKSKNIVLTGIPRSGTTLACFLMGQLENTVALNEPMRTKSLKTYSEALAKIPIYFEETRQGLLNTGKAISRASKGRFTDNHFSNEKGVRSKLVRKQEVDVSKVLTEDFNLIIKHNALFTLLLDDLMLDFPTYAIIRHPGAVLGSWNSLDLPASKGQIRVANWLAPDLASELSSIDDLFERQFFILNWYFEKYKSLDDDKIIKYEDVIASEGSVFGKVVSSANDLKVPLSNRNKNTVYNDKLVRELLGKLKSTNNACWDFYDKDFDFIMN